MKKVVNCDNKRLSFSFFKEGNMIVSYGARNCWSFKDWLEIDFSINKNVSEEYGFKDIRIVPALCFEGANASGKSNALRVLSFIMDFCINSFSYRQKNLIPYDTFFNNGDKSDIYISFCVAEELGKVYTYEAEIDTTKIYSEKLYYTEGKKKRYLIKRINNKITFNDYFIIPENLILKDNASFISTFDQYGMKEITVFADFFRSIISNVAYVGTYDSELTDYVAEYYYNNPDIHKKVFNQLKQFDTGIEDVSIVPAYDSNGNRKYMSIFKHKADAENVELNYFNQSTGTKLLYNKLMDFYLTIENGGILVFDELDNHLHSAIIPYLLEYFLDFTTNKNHAQIVFTSHDSSLLDTMKKYRTYLFNKDLGESICYRIDEIPSNNVFRNDRSLEQIYKMGMLGGVPNV